MPLTALGEEEARRAGERLKGLHLDVAYTSGLRRAQDTLRLILESMGADIPTIRDQALSERKVRRGAGKDLAPQLRCRTSGRREPEDDARAHGALL